VQSYIILFKSQITYQYLELTASLISAPDFPTRTHLCTPPRTSSHGLNSALRTAKYRISAKSCTSRPGFATFHTILRGEVQDLQDFRYFAGQRGRSGSGDIILTAGKWPIPDISCSRRRCQGCYIVFGVDTICVRRSVLRVPAREDDVRGATLSSGWVLYA
jgi:hypothetical protein